MRQRQQSELVPGAPLEGRLEAIVALLVPIMRALAKSESVIESAEEKALLALDRAGVPQLQIAKLLGISNNRVNDLLKKRKTTKTHEPTAVTEGSQREG